MKFEYLKPVLKDLSKGSRLAFVRKFRDMSQKEVAEHFGFGGERPGRSISRYENGERNPKEDRLKEFAKLYNVSYQAIKDYDFTTPLDTIYELMWIEEQFPNYELNLETSTCMLNTNNITIQKAIKVWNEMREKRRNREITYEEYINWKLNFKL